MAAGLAVLLVLGIACGNGEAADKSETDTSGVAPAEAASMSEQAAVSIGTASPSGGAVAVVPQTAQAAGYVPGLAGAPYVQAVTSQAGISVTGEGVMSLAPDLAMLNVGVEATADTVSDALEQAAQAMDSVIDALHDRGIEDKDIQTRYFNISPRYEWMEVIDGGVRSSKQVLIGYAVNNSASVKIRDLDAAGEIIDEVATAGGNDVRINGISFTVEDPKPLMTQLREAAVNDALAKAQHFATLTGVSLGRLVFISEYRSTPVVRDFAEAERFGMAMAASAPTTTISGGELELRLSVQAVFDIQ